MNTTWKTSQVRYVVGMAFVIATWAPSVRAAAWTEKPLLVFNGNGTGGVPSESLIFDSAGNLYGATSIGGDMNCSPGNGCGVVFKLTPDSNGGWHESISLCIQRRNRRFRSRRIFRPGVRR